MRNGQLASHANVTVTNGRFTPLVLEMPFVVGSQFDTLHVYRKGMEWVVACVISLALLWLLHHLSERVSQVLINEIQEATMPRAAVRRNFS